MYGQDTEAAPVTAEPPPLPKNDTSILTRILSTNDLGVLTTMFLDGAKEVHVAMCLLDEDHAAQSRLRRSATSLLAGAQMCFTLYGSEKMKAVKNG